MADHPLPSPPFIDVPGINNFRDVGGYPAQPAGSIRRGILFRSANPTHVKPDGLKVLQSLRVAKVFDFRSEPEVVKGSEAEGANKDTVARKGGPDHPYITRDDDAPSPDTMSGGSAVEGEAPDGRIRRVWCPVFRSRDYTSTASAERYQAHARESSSVAQATAKGYADILANAGPAYEPVLTHLASADGPAPCLIHCTAGKDRTGAFVALVLLLCGVETEVIAREYALTTRGLGAGVLANYKTHLMKALTIPDKERVIHIMLGSHEENMMAVVEMINARFGGAEAYIKQVVGLDDEAIGRLKRNLVSQKAAVL